MSLPATHADELGVALDALDLLIATRIEERRGGTGPSGMLGRPAPPAGEGLPERAVFGREGPLAQVVDAGQLGPAEAVTLLATIAREVEDRYDPLFAALADRPGTAGLTGEVARTLAARTSRGRLAFPDLLAPDAPLVVAGLVELVPAEPTLAGTLRAAPDFLGWALGRPVSLGSPGEGFPARPLTTVHSLDDVVAPHAQRAQLTALVDRIRDRDLVVGEWGFGDHHDSVSGLVALFHGPSGTGKSMAAAAIGRAAGLPVRRVDLSQVVDKYIGETAKRLGAVFDRAAREGWLLLFDEADAVFGRRTEVADAHDRYANQDVSYLLTRLEDHPGVVILTTNLLANIDEAFQRRLHVVVQFEPPGLAERTTLWSRVLPTATPVDGVDWSRLARRYPLTGAQIRDAAVDAAYQAAADGKVVTLNHLTTGIRTQFAKAGRTVPTAER